jgi:hypothetical protein
MKATGMWRKLQQSTRMLISKSLQVADDSRSDCFEYPCSGSDSLTSSTLLKSTVYSGNERVRQPFYCLCERPYRWLVGCYKRPLAGSSTFVGSHPFAKVRRKDGARRLHPGWARIGPGSDQDRARIRPKLSFEGCRSFTFVFLRSLWASSARLSRLLLAAWCAC